MSKEIMLTPQGWMKVRYNALGMRFDGSKTFDLLFDDRLPAEKVVRIAQLKGWKAAVIELRFPEFCRGEKITQEL
jgi:hypothetical protein